MYVSENTVESLSTEKLLSLTAFDLGKMIARDTSPFTGSSLNIVIFLKLFI